MGEESVDAFIRKGKKMIGEDGVITFVISCGFISSTRPLLSHIPK